MQRTIWNLLWLILLNITRQCGLTQSVNRSTRMDKDMFGRPFSVSSCCQKTSKLWWNSKSGAMFLSPIVKTFWWLYDCWHWPIKATLICLHHWTDNVSLVHVRSDSLKSTSMQMNNDELIDWNDDIYESVITAQMRIVTYLIHASVNTLFILFLWRINRFVLLCNKLSYTLHQATVWTLC